MIRPAQPEDAGRVQELLREYATGLGIDLSFQDFEAELADPLAFYEVVLLADDDGCVGLRRVDDRMCEMKRLFVRPEARAGGLGRRLAEAIVAEARKRGYRRMLLDTLPSMAAAQTLYSSLGFRETEPYRYNPVPGTRFLELPL
ncbi:MAG: GNAT family N-acetyltransferase [Actinobacteria bacterium]|nr:GNAT family N-acetyltransferase [Actinomycetota bacterium]